MRMHFSKYEGIGNDFIVIDAKHRSLLSDNQVKLLCDRRRGIGADGILALDMARPSPHMHITNADGSVPEMCGNGIRCIALHLWRCRAITAPQIDIDTDAGLHRCSLSAQQGRDLPAGAAATEAQVEVRMRAASLAPEKIGMRASEPLIEHELVLDSHQLKVTAVSMGNPHLVTFTELSAADRRQLGPKLQASSLFPAGVNVGFAYMTAADAMDLHVLERGAGWTQACGTGACAAAFAAIHTGRAQRHQPIRVNLPGGTLSITVANDDDAILMQGPARHVFDGTVALNESA